MARFKDALPSQQGWIHDLARAEIHPDAERLLQLDGGSDPHQRVEESTIDFLGELRAYSTEYARIFNAFAESGSKFQEVKVYSVAQTAADFMIFRNQVKLVVANTAHGVIQISFAQHARGQVGAGAMSVDGQLIQASPAVGNGSPSQDLLAQVGPFRDVYWTFQGERVTPEQVAKAYFAEFVRASRDIRKSKAGNQLLIDQIKALLQEKGLDL